MRELIFSFLSLGGGLKEGMWIASCVALFILHRARLFILCLVRLWVYKYIYLFAPCCQV